MKSFCIITANWNRPEVLTLWCASIKRIREDLDIFIPAVVVSDRWDSTICNKYHIHHINHRNNPVSEKFNAGCKYAESIGVDYVMVLGSDDIVSTDTIRRDKETPLYLALSNEALNNTSGKGEGEKKNSPNTNKKNV